MDIDESIIKALNYINLDEYDSALNIVQTILNDNESFKKLTSKHWQIIAGIYLASGKFDLSKDSFSTAENYIGIAFLMIFSGKLAEAEVELSKSGDSPPKRWCVFLVQLFSDRKIVNWPTFLEIRHFLEFTVYYLLRINNQLFINKTLSVLNKLLFTNPDSEKYIAYAYYNVGNFDRAVELLSNTIKRDKCDGEAYFKLGEIYLSLNRKQLALEMLEKAQIFFPSHTILNELVGSLKSNKLLEK
jgi:tetratricopeptide (TPR) repeat protein